MRPLALALVVFIVVGAPPLRALADPRAVDEVLAATGVKSQIDQLVRHLVTQRDTAFKNARAEARARLDAVFAAGRGALVIAFFRSPLARTMAQLEGEAQTEEAQPELRAFALRLKGAPADPPRVALLQRLDAAAQQTETQIAITVGSLRSFALMANVALPPNRRRTSEQIDKQLGAIRGRLEQATKDVAVVRGLFTYRSVTDDDLRTYVDFHDSEMGRWYLGLLTKGVREALEHSATIIVARVQEEIRRQDRPCVGLPCLPPVR